MTIQLTAEELDIQQQMDIYIFKNKATLDKWKQEQILQFVNIAQKQFENSKKTKQITIRISETDLIKLKSKSIKTWIPYQTLIWSQIHQFANA